MKIKISSTLRKEILGIGIDPKTISGIKEWEMIISLLDKKFWATPDEAHEQRVSLSTACAHAEKIFDDLCQEWFHAI